ncbi:hypothetical protein GGI43DRAFT_355755 [Trichoderma evansii]
MSNSCPGCGDTPLAIASSTTGFLTTLLAALAFGYGVFQLLCTSREDMRKFREDFQAFAYQVYVSEFDHPGISPRSVMASTIDSRSIVSGSLRSREERDDISLVSLGVPGDRPVTRAPTIEDAALGEAGLIRERIKDIIKRGSDLLEKKCFRDNNAKDLSDRLATLTKLIPVFGPVPVPAITLQIGREYSWKTRSRIGIWWWWTGKPEADKLRNEMVKIQGHLLFRGHSTTLQLINQLILRQNLEQSIPPRWPA